MAQLFFFGPCPLCSLCGLFARWSTLLFLVNLETGVTLLFIPLESRQIWLVNFVVSLEMGK
jgi:hypothetical protein